MWKKLLILSIICASALSLLFVWQKQTTDIKSKQILDEFKKVDDDLKRINDSIRASYIPTDARTIRCAFISQNKIYERWYLLRVREESGIVKEFKTVMPLSEFEISKLKKAGNNLLIIYSENYNPVTKSADKIAKSIVPIYE